MYWTKILTKHFLYSEYTLVERGALATLFCLTAHLERIPTEKEMLGQVTQTLLKTIRHKLGDQSATLREVLDRVVEDVPAHGSSTERVRKHRAAKECNMLHETHVTPIDKIREEKRRILNTGGNKFVPPSIEEVKGLIMERGYRFDAESFIAHYTTNGWLVGKNKMKDWKSACVTWEKRVPINKVLDPMEVRYAHYK